MVYLPESEPIQSRNTKMVHEIIALEQLLTLMASLTPFAKGFNQVNTPRAITTTDALQRRSKPAQSCTMFTDERKTELN